jgi:uncharacterized protein Yka (UPF0111/DUF47 family)
VASDIDRLKGIVEKTETDVREIINLCIKGAEACKKHEEELNGDLEHGRLNEIRQEIITPRTEIQGKYNDTFQKFLMHVCQSHHLAFEMKTTMLYQRQQDILMQFVNWYCFIGDISEVCLQSLVSAKDKLYASDGV